jgi:hypothetical protein
VLHHLSFGVLDRYHAAFVIDPDGYRIEAVINAPA